MRQLVDGILYIDSLSGLIAHFLTNAPERLKADGEGNIEADPYIVTGFDRTPIKQSGNTALVYVRMTPDEATGVGRNAARHDPRAAPLRGRCAGRALCRPVRGQ